MRNKLINILLILVSFIIPSNVYALSTTDANEKIDVTKECTLTLNYYYNDYDFSNTNVEIYKVASVNSDFQYRLSSEFSSYPIKINGIKTDKEWTSLEQTLNAYIEADKIEATISEVVKDNKVVVTNLETGLYLIKIDKIDREDYSLIFDSFLVSLPDLNEEGTWNYDVNIYPKAEEYIPKYDDIKYTVIKEWIDDAEKRPDSIEIEIYEDGNLVDTQVLSKDNNWKYEWITEDDGSKWSVVERNIPEGYEVYITDKDRNFVIVNLDSEYTEKSPQTYDNIKMYFCLLFTSIIGLILITISFVLQKKN